MIETLHSYPIMSALAGPATDVGAALAPHVCAVPLVIYFPLFAFRFFMQLLGLLDTEFRSKLRARRAGCIATAQGKSMV